VVSDQLNHASIIDAVKVAGVQNKFRYNHSDMGDLEKQLIAASELQHRTAEKAPPLGSARGRLLLLLRGDRPKLGCSGWLGAPTGETGPLCAHSAARAKPPPKPPRARRRELAAESSPPLSTQAEDAQEERRAPADPCDHGRRLLDGRRPRQAAQDRRAREEVRRADHGTRRASTLTRALILALILALALALALALTPSPTLTLTRILTLGGRRARRGGAGRGRPGSRQPLRAGGDADPLATDH